MLLQAHEQFAEKMVTCGQIWNEFSAHAVVDLAVVTVYSTMELPVTRRLSDVNRAVALWVDEVKWISLELLHALIRAFFQCFLGLWG